MIDPELKRIAYTFLAGWFAWMVKDILMGERDQLRKNTEAVGSLQTRVAIMEADINSAFSSIRELKGTKNHES